MTGLGRRVVRTDRAPAPVGPYSQGVVAGNFLFVSGQIPVDPGTGKLVKGGIEEQARRALENLRAVLEAAGYSLEDVVMVHAFLARLEDYPGFNRVYEEFFGDVRPARVTVQAGVPKGALVEVAAIAYRD